MKRTCIMVDSNIWHKLGQDFFQTNELKEFTNIILIKLLPVTIIRIVILYYTRSNYLNCVGVNGGTQLCLCYILKGTLVPSTVVYLQYISIRVVTGAFKICTLFLWSSYFSYNGEKETVFVHRINIIGDDDSHSRCFLLCLDSWTWCPY